jgi:hypothetical protein
MIKLGRLVGVEILPSSFSEENSATKKTKQKELEHKNPLDHSNTK